VGVISEPLKLINDLHHTTAGRKRFGRLATLAAIEGGLMATLGILGVGTGDPQQILGEMRDRSLARHGMTQADVQGAIDDRRKARDDKDWARADVLRDELLAKGVQLMDSPAGTTWRPLYELTNQEEEG
jgi:cysteinyl-tRNA synthetase